MGKTDWRGYWVLFWRAGPCSVNLKFNFLLMGGAVFSPCCLTWDQTMVEVMKIMSTSIKRSHACTAALSALDHAAGHHLPTPLPETPGHSRVSLGQSLVGSLLLSPGSWCAQGFICALQESVAPVLCKFWWLYGGVNGDLFQRAYAIPRSAAHRAPNPEAGYFWPVPPQERLTHSSASVSLGSPGPGAHKVCLSPLSISGGYRVWF